VADAAAKTFVPPERRGLGMVFQDYALWPHMSVARNVAFPLEMQGVAKAEREARVARALERVGLATLGDRGPGELSGGQQQRVAIARAIVGEPALVLFDEPLSNLDRELREIMVEEIAQLLSNLGLTAIYVTHDHGEALTLADEVAVMRKGEIVQLAAPETLVERPASPYVAEFLKLGTVAPIGFRDGGVWLADTGIRLETSPDNLPPADSVSVLLGRNAVRLADAAESPIRGTVLRSQFRGDGHWVAVRLGNENSSLELQMLSDVRLKAGEHVGVEIAPQRLRWFPAD
jgi:iron(III) transport system ATP-binding protein